MRYSLGSIRAVAIVSVFLTLTPISSFGQQVADTSSMNTDAPLADSSRPTVLPDIVVTANRIPLTLLQIPAAVQTLKVMDLPPALYHSPSDVAATIPGVRSYSTGNSWGNANVDVRGFYGGGQAQYLMVTYDGIPLNSISSGLVDWTDLNLAELNRMEAIKGPASAQYGDFGFGGLLALFSNTPQGPLRGKVTATFASADAFRVYASVSGRGSGIGCAVVPSAASSKGWRRHSELRSQRVVVTATQEASPRVGLTYLLSFGHSREELPGALTESELASDRTSAARDMAGNAQPDMTKSTQLLGGVTANVRLSSSTELRPVLYFKASQADNIVTITSSLSHKPDVWAGGLDISLGTQRTLLDRDLKLVGGVDLEFGRSTSKYSAYSVSRELLTSGRGRRSIVSGYFHGLYYLTERLFLASGARVDHTETGFDYDSARLTEAGKRERYRETAFSPKIAAGLRLSRNLSLYASVSGAFKSPTFVHLFDSPPVQSQFGYLLISSHSLRALRGTEYELGVRLMEEESYYLSLDCFSYEIRNEIEFDFATFRYANIGKSRHRGVELSSSASLGGRLRAELGFGYNQSTYQQGEFTGNQINGVPEFTYHARVTAKIRQPWQISGILDGRVNQYMDEANEHKLGNYSVVGVASDYALGPIRLAIAVTNLLDAENSVDGYLGALGEKRYYPAPGRTFTASVETSF